MSLWAPLDPENISNPYPMYRDLRLNDPVYRASSGEWIITRYEDVRSILKSPDFRVGNKREWMDRGITYFKHKERDFTAIADAINTFILLIDPPRHTELRKFVIRAWDDKEVADQIRQHIEELRKGYFGRADFDFIEHFARPLPVMTIARILGIPIEDCQELQNWGFSLVKVLDLYNKVEDLVRIEKASSDLIRYFEDHLVKLKDHGGEGLISKIVELNKTTLRLSDKELISICIFLLIAGQETTVGLIGTGLRNLFIHEDQRKKLTDHPEIMNLAIEELLRFDGPVHLLGRIAKRNTVLNGHEIREGDTLTLCIASANRDESKYENGEKLRLDRDPRNHLAFGAGIHFCLGDWLAKLQGAMALEEIIANHPDYCVRDTTPDWNNNLSIRTLSSLPAILN